MRHRLGPKTIFTHATTLTLACLLATSATAGSAASDTLQLQVAVSPKPKGVCTAHAYRVAKPKETPRRLRDAQRAVDDVEDLQFALKLPAGWYDVVVACPARDGEVRQSTRVHVKRAQQSLKVKLQEARALVEVHIDGSAMTKTAVFFDANGREVQRGPSQTLVTVPAGKLSVAVLVDDKRLLKKGFRLVGEGQLKARPRRKAETVVDISEGILVVTATNNGKPSSALGAVRAAGDAERLLEFTTGEEVSLPAGSYDVVTQLDDAHDVFEQVTRKVRVRPSKTTKVTSKHKTGTVRLKAVLGETAFGFGQAPPSTLKTTTELFFGAAPAPYNEVDPAEELVLAPGDHRVRITQKGRKLDDGSAVFAEATVRVRAGRRTTSTLVLSPFVVEGKTVVGEFARPMEVELLRAKDLAVLAQKTSDEDGKVRFTTRERLVVVQAKLKDGDDEYLAKDRVQLTQAAPTAVELGPEVGEALVQVFDGDMAVRAKVLFFKEGAAEPKRVTRSGKKVLVPPGRYQIVVERKGKRWAYPRVVINAQRLMERQVVLNDAALLVEDEDEDDDDDDDDD